jgi:NAD-reducing hydrogenase large subunit
MCRVIGRTRLRWALPSYFAKHFVDGKKLKEGMLNRVEAGIRAFDPCLSCSTHAYGEMPLKIELCEPDGTVVDTVTRD